MITGNPLTDITNTRHVQIVMKAGFVYDPRVLLNKAVGKIGPNGPQPKARAQSHP